MNCKKWESLLENPSLQQTIALDWLELFMKPDNLLLGTNLDLPGFIIPTPIEKETNYILSEGVGLQLQPFGSPMYANRWTVNLWGEEFAILQTHPRKTIGGLTADCMSLKVLNHHLYTENLTSSLYEVLEGLNAKYISVSRLDIAIDGTNEVNRFLNDYTKQMDFNKTCHMKGRAKFSPMDQDHKTMTFERFIIGSGKSGKQVSLYCKSKELEVSNKKYIERFWLKSGMNVSPGQEVFRTELRLRSEGVKAILDFDLFELDKPEYLASIYKTSAENFFQFSQFTDDSNVSRQEAFYPINFNLFKAELLEKATKAKTNDRYKVKISTARAVKHCIKSEISDYQKMLLLTNIPYDLRLWDLWDWYEKKIEHWIEEFTAKGTRNVQPKYLKELRAILNQRPIQSKKNENKESKKDREGPESEESKIISEILDHVISGKNLEPCPF